MVIHIARHGQPAIDRHTEAPRGDPPLTNLGTAQAQRLGQRLKADGFDGPIIASPYLRTAETADVIAEVLDRDFRVDARLREFTNVEKIDAFEGMRGEELEARFQRLRKPVELPYPWWSLGRTQRESPDELVERVRPMIEELFASEAPQALLVGHGASTGACMRCLIGQETLEALRNGHAHWNCSLTSIRARPAVQPIRLFDFKHLPHEMITSNLLTYAEHWDNQK